MAASTRDHRESTARRCRYPLFWYEGRAARLRAAGQTRRSYARPLATGENLFSMQDAET